MASTHLAAQRCLQRCWLRRPSPQPCCAGPAAASGHCRFALHRSGLHLLQRVPAVLKFAPADGGAGVQQEALEDGGKPVGDVTVCRSQHLYDVLPQNVLADGQLQRAGEEHPNSELKVKVGGIFRMRGVGHSR